MSGRCTLAEPPLLEVAGLHAEEADGEEGADNTWPEPEREFHRAALPDDVNPEDPSVLLLTSGTTARSKGSSALARSLGQRGSSGLRSRAAGELIAARLRRRQQLDGRSSPQRPSVVVQRPPFQLIGMTGPDLQPPSQMEPISSRDGRL